MIHGPMAMIQKWRHSHPSGNHLVFHAQESMAKSQQDQDHVNVFFDWEYVVHHQYTIPGQAINNGYYLNIPHWLREAIWQEQLQLWAPGDWQLHHDNMPAHVSCLVQSFFAKHQITELT